METAYEISPLESHDELALMDLELVFQPVLQARFEQEKANIITWVERMIETDTWTPFDAESDVMYAASAHDMNQIIVDAVHPLIHRWPLALIATLIREILWYHLRPLYLSGACTIRFTGFDLDILDGAGTTQSGWRVSVCSSSTHSPSGSTRMDQAVSDAN